MAAVSQAHEPPKAHPSLESLAVNDAELAQDSSHQDRYSFFSPRKKKLITAIIGFSMLFSPLTANIYFPGLVQIQKDLHITPELVDLTITSYLIVQGISPVLFGDAVVLFGRRPVFIVMFCVYVLANIALALQDSFVALLVLRMVQSLGCSATIAVSYGVIADVSTPAERGSMQGIAITATNLGPVLAPVIGVTILLFLPETARNIVGNGKMLPTKWGQPLVSRIFGIQIPKAGQPSKAESPARKPTHSLLVLLVSGIFYLIYYCVQASITSELKEIYGFDESIIGAYYLAIGVGVIIGGFVNGKLMNYNYKRQARDIGHRVDKVNGDNLMKFPIKQARTRSMAFLNVAHLVTLAAYGWRLQKRVFILGGLETCIVPVSRVALSII
ncbi:chloramphenicol resistance protein [Ustulina deusta]|nr:chloramphenicol resistance protein [Ustulina deusta]